jgi:hypothetical protein
VKALLTALLLVPALIAGADDTLFQSDAKQTTLIELFTSEGCSSCPPAEAWFTTLLENPALWKQFVPVAFHVDYWDGLGWKDRFAAPAFTQRQRTYADAWHGDSVYTPGFVMNGGEWKSLGRPPLSATDARPGVLTVSRVAEKIAVSFAPSDPGAAEWEIHLALLGCGLRTDVVRGENAGRELRHDFVALSFQTRPAETGGAALGARFDFPKTTRHAERLALAVWITHAGSLTPVQATGGWLTPRAPAE